MNDRLKSLYQTVILAKTKDEKFVGELESYTHSITAYNPLCGDKFEVQMIVEDDVVKSLKYNGSGCSVSKASTAVLCEKLEGSDAQQVLERIAEFLEIVDADASRNPEEITKNEELLAFAAAREFPERKSCADLSWKELQKQFNQLFPYHLKE